MTPSGYKCFVIPNDVQRSRCRGKAQSQTCAPKNGGVPPGSSKEEAPPSFLVRGKVRFHRLHRPKVGSWTLLQFRKVSDSEPTLSSIVRAMSKLVRNVPF